MNIQKLIFTITLISMCACADSGLNKTTAPPNEPQAQAETPKTTVDVSIAPSSEQAAPGTDESASPDIIKGEVTISFDYEKVPGSASNQFAVWIEDINGRLIKTLYATRYTAKGGYKIRPDSIALWVNKSGLAAMEKSEIDAVTSATPKAGPLSYTWDLTDANGEIVSPGEYKFFVEGTLRWKNYVLYSGVIDINKNPATIIADAEFIYEATDRQPALSADSSENSMIGPVTANFVPE